MAKVPPFLVLVILLSPFLILYLTGNTNFHFLGSTTSLTSNQFDQASSFTTFGAASCIGSSGPSWCPSSPQMNRGTSGWITNGPTATVLLGQAAAYYSQNQPVLYTGGQCNYIPGGIVSGPSWDCSTARAILGGYGGTTTYGLTASTSASNWQLLGSSANSGWQNQFQESIPQGNCPLTVISGGCNPYTIVLGSSAPNSSIAYNIYRFAFLFTLQTFGDKVVASTTCNVISLSITGGDSSQCTASEVNSLNKALGFINSANSNTGTVVIDFSVPDPFYYSSIGASSNDQYGIIGAWIGGIKGCVLSNVQFGETFSVSPCNSHALVGNNLSPYSPASNEPSLTSYTNPVISSLNPNGQFSFTLNSLSIQYSAVQCTSGSGSNCPGSTSADCLTTGGCVIQSDSGVIMQIPMVLDVIGTGPNLQTQARNIGLITTTTGPPYNPLTGNIIVTVKDSLLNLPVSGIPVNYGSGSTCATTNSYGTTNAQGQVNIVGLATGPYTVCTTGQSGTVTLIFVSFQLTYSLASQTVPGGVTGGQTMVVNMSIQPSFNSQLTTISIVLFAVGIIALIAIIIIAPTSLVSLGIGGARAYRTYKGKK
jgi:hypothetical protein